MSDTKKAKATKKVSEMVEVLKNDESSRFSKNDFQALVYAVLADEEFKSKKYLVHGNVIQVKEVSDHSDMMVFLDKLLKHAGMTDSAERANVLDTFEYGPNDIGWVVDAVDEAMFIYSDCDKNMRIFRDKMLQLTVKKMIRTGKYAGKTTFKKSVLDRAAMIAKKAAAE